MLGRLALVLGGLTGLLGVANVVMVSGLLNQPERSRLIPLMSALAILCALVALGAYLQTVCDHPLGLMVTTVATMLLIGLTAMTAMSFGLALAPAALLALATMVAGWTALCARWYDLTAGPLA